jgi:hypothetical protein
MLMVARAETVLATIEHILSIAELQPLTAPADLIAVAGTEPERGRDHG